MIELEALEAILLILFVVGLVIEGVSLIMLSNPQPQTVTKVIYLPRF